MLLGIFAAAAQSHPLQFLQISPLFFTQLAFADCVALVGSL
jgi:hypothetical protein